MRSILFILSLIVAIPVVAQEDLVPMEASQDDGREPAALPTPNGKRTYPGGADEEDLRVLSTLPEAPLKTDARGIQKEVFKSLYNQELKDDRPETIEE